MAVNTHVSRSVSQGILAHLRALRASVDQARGALMHYKDDRVDRDKLEPAARRVDDLMNMFATGMQDRPQGLLWMAAIQSGVDEVVNPKAAGALRDASVEIAAILLLMNDSRNETRSGADG